MAGKEEPKVYRGFELILLRTIALLTVILSIATWVTFIYVIGNRRVIQNNSREIRELRQELSKLNSIADKFHKEGTHEGQSN